MFWTLVRNIRVAGCDLSAISLPIGVESSSEATADLNVAIGVSVRCVGVEFHAGTEAESTTDEVPSDSSNVFSLSVGATSVALPASHPTQPSVLQPLSN